MKLSSGFKDKKFKIGNDEYKPRFAWIYRSSPCTSSRREGLVQSLENPLSSTDLTTTCVHTDILSLGYRNENAPSANQPSRGTFPI